MIISYVDAIDSLVHKQHLFGDRLQDGGDYLLLHGCGLEDESPEHSGSRVLGGQRVQAGTSAADTDAQKRGEAAETYPL